MDFRDFIKVLKKQEPSANIELDPVKEAEYMAQHAHRFERIIEAIPKAETLRILDIGATPFTIFLKENFPAYEVYALDRTDMLKERMNKEVIELRSCNLDDGILPFESNFFDVIIFTEVLEHVFYPPQEILKEVLRILHTHGKLIISVPNIAALGNRIKLLLGISILEKADVQLNRDWIHGHGHIHEYTRKEIKNLIREVGFEIVKTEMLSVKPMDVLKNRVQFSIKRLLYYFVCFVVPAFRFTIFLECFKDF